MRPLDPLCLVDFDPADLGSHFIMGEICKVCQEDLTLEVQDDDENTQLVPDDVLLPCGCHFHWQCLLDQSASMSISLGCPSCAKKVVTNAAGPSVTNPFLHASSNASIFVRYTNEGGVQENLDILPEVTEEAYLEAHPEARPARAMLVMSGEGDVGGIVELLRDAEGLGNEPGQAEEEMDQGEGMTTAQLIRYQDPLSDMKSGLHIAIEKGQFEIVWLFLWIASTVKTDVFPEEALQVAQSLGLRRPPIVDADDIRALKDSKGRTAEEFASQNQGIWAEVLQAGVLHPGS